MVGSLRGTLQVLMTSLLLWPRASLAFSIVSRHHKNHRPSSFFARQHSSLSSLVDSSTTPSEGSRFEVCKGSLERKILIHWRGERDAGYSKRFRHIEFEGALAAALNVTQQPTLEFVNALNYTGEEPLPACRIEHFNEAMQYISLPQDDKLVTREGILEAVERCSLVHAAYEVVASAETLKDLPELGEADGGFEDMYVGGPNEKMTWSFRVRSFGNESSSETKDKRYGENARSMEMEREGLNILKPLLIKLGGKVNLRNPDCQVYLFDGLENTKKVLTRRIAEGPKTSVIKPNTRICVTNTPLEPIAAYSLCNVAQLQQCSRIFDPYCGSAATLLAASLIAPDCDTVGVEISHMGIVNRDDIREDFRTRNLKLPRALIYGDSTNSTIRDEARAAIGNRPFTTIVTDPPYGIRESSRQNEKTPLENMFDYITADRDAGKRLLEVGGRLVAFVPVTEEESLSRNLPSKELAEHAGLEYQLAREQQLNEKLSRWLVSYKCVR